MLTLTTGLHDATPAALSTGPVEEARRILALLPDTLAAIHSQALPSFWVSLFVGGALAVASWLGAVYFARLWNRRYRLRCWQHMLCAAAALVTLAAVPIWAAAGYVQETANAVDALWQDRLAVDQTWQQETYAEAYAATEQLHPQAFVDIPQPGQIGSHIPLPDTAAVRVVADVYVERTARYLRERYPRLRALVSELQHGTLTSTEAWTRLHASGALYPLEQQARTAATGALAGVLGPVRLWVWRTRLAAGSLFLGVHLLAFGVIGSLAARDIRVHA